MQVYPTLHSFSLGDHYPGRQLRGVLVAAQVAQMRAAGFLEFPGLEVENAQRFVGRLPFNAVDFSGDTNAIDDPGGVFRIEVTFVIQDLPSLFPLVGLDGGPPFETLAGALALDEDGNGQVVAVFAGYDGIKGVLEELRDLLVMIAVANGVGGKFFHHLVTEGAEVAGIQFNRGPLVQLHAEAPPQVKAKGTTQVIPEASDREAREDAHGIVWWGRGQLPGERPGGGFPGLGFFLEEGLDPAGKFFGGTGKEEAGGPERIPASTAPPEEEIDLSALVAPTGQERAQNVGVAGVPGFIVTKAEKAAGPVREVGVPLQGFRDEPVIQPGNHEMGSVLPGQLEPALQVEGPRFSLLVD